MCGLYSYNKDAFIICGLYCHNKDVFIIHMLYFGSLTAAVFIHWATKYIFNLLLHTVIKGKPYGCKITLGWLNDDKKITFEWTNYLNTQTLTETWFKWNMNICEWILCVFVDRTEGFITSSCRNVCERQMYRWHK